MTHALSLSVFIVFKGTNFYISLAYSVELCLYHAHSIVNVVNNDVLTRGYSMN